MYFQDVLGLVGDFTPIYDLFGSLFEEKYWFLPIYHRKTHFLAILWLFGAQKDLCRGKITPQTPVHIESTCHWVSKNMGYLKKPTVETLGVGT